MKSLGEVIGRTPFKDRITQINKLYDEGSYDCIQFSRGLKSGRGEPHYSITEQQLKEWGVKYHDLWFKKHDDYSLHR